jgi:hypothetical protein
MESVNCQKKKTVGATQRTVCYTSSSFLDPRYKICKYVIENTGGSTRNRYFLIPLYFDQANFVENYKKSVDF